MSYSDGVRNVVRAIGHGCVWICEETLRAKGVDTSDIRAAIAEDLVYEEKCPFHLAYALSNKGVKLLYEMEAGKTLEFEARPKIWGFWNWRARPTPSPRFIEIPANVHVKAGETYRVTLAPVESEPAPNPEPEPQCPICGKSAGEHLYGLFCCPKCHGKNATDGMGELRFQWRIECPDCGLRTKICSTCGEATEDWNRRA